MSSDSDSERDGSDAEDISSEDDLMHSPRLERRLLCRQCHFSHRVVHGLCLSCRATKVRGHRAAEKKARLIGISPVQCQVPGCNRPKLVLDHDHETWEPRFVLCHHHNDVLGKFDDEPLEMHRWATVAMTLFGAPDPAWDTVYCEAGHGRQHNGCNPCDRMRLRAQRQHYLPDAKAKGFDMSECSVCGTGGNLVVHHFRNDPNMEARAVLHRGENMALGKLGDDPAEALRIANALIHILNQTDPVPRWGVNFVGAGKGTAGQRRCAVCERWFSKHNIATHKQSANHHVSVLWDID